MGSRHFPVRTLRFLLQKQQKQERETLSAASGLKPRCDGWCSSGGCVPERSRLPLASDCLARHQIYTNQVSSSFRRVSCELFNRNVSHSSSSSSSSDFRDSGIRRWVAKQTEELAVCQTLWRKIFREFFFNSCSDVIINSSVFAASSHLKS